MAGWALTSTPFRASLDRMLCGEQSYDETFVARAVDLFPADYTFPLSLGLHFVEQGDYVGALGAFQQARDRVLLGLESRPEDRL